MKSKTIEILYKPYSTDVMGYILRISDYIYLVINSRLSTKESEKVKTTLNELADSHPPSKLILLQGDGNIYKTDNLDFLERAC